MEEFKEFFKLVNSGNHEAAIHVLKGFSLEELKVEPRVLFHLADCYYEAQDYSEAFRLYKFYFSNYPNNRETPYALYNVALILFEEFQYAEALEILRKIKVHHPNRALLEGECLYKLERCDEAIGVLEEEARRVSDSNLLWQLGLCFNAVDRHDESLDAFQKCFALEGAGEDVCNAIVTELIWLGRRDEAEEFCQSFEPELRGGRALWKLGDSYNSHREFESSIRVLNRYLVLNKLDAEAWLLLGVNYYLLTPPNFDLSRECLERALLIDPASEAIKDTLI